MRIISGLLELAGLCGLGYGLYMYDPRLAFVVIGSLVMVGGITVDLMIRK